ncbi:MAG: hypothetical protein RL033_3170 [Pseudomonadota bacterium]|jgi:tetratricopeptide (TPR) repeat protein
MRRSSARWAPTLVTTAALLLAPSARAQADSAAARTLFAEGRQLMSGDKYAEACPKFEESLRLDPGMGTQFNLAHCWEKLGRSASAWALFLDVAAAARASNQPEREAAAKDRATLLEGKLTRLRLVVPEPTAGTKIYRDQQEVGRAAWGTAMAIDPGDHVIRVVAPGKKDWTHDVKLPPNARTFSVTVPTLEELPVAQQGSEEPKAATVPTYTSVPRDGGDNRGTSVAALVVGGIGVAALATGTVFALQGYADNREALKMCRSGANKNECDGPPERERHEQLVRDAKREQLIGLVTLGIGGAAVVTATVLLLTANGDAPEQASLQVNPLWAEGRLGASLTGRF